MLIIKAWNIKKIFLNPDFQQILKHQTTGYPWVCTCHGDNPLEMSCSSRCQRGQESSSEPLPPASNFLKKKKMELETGKQEVSLFGKTKWTAEHGQKPISSESWMCSGFVLSGLSSSSRTRRGHRATREWTQLEASSPDPVMLRTCAGQHW